MNERDGVVSRPNVDNPARPVILAASSRRFLRLLAEPGFDVAAT
jgi:hypothetical protein